MITQRTLLKGLLHGKVKKNDARDYLKIHAEVGDRNGFSSEHFNSYESDLKKAKEWGKKVAKQKAMSNLTIPL